VDWGKKFLKMKEVSGIRIIPNGEIALRKMSMIISSIIQQMSEKLVGRTF